jgi:hypothetical protein
MSARPMTLLEREERVLRILANPARHDMNTQAAYRAQWQRLQRLGRDAAPPIPDETVVPCTWHARVEGEPA